MAKLRHIAIAVPDLDAQTDLIKEHGGTFFMELPVDKDSLYFEAKFRDPDGIVFDVSHNGWVGAAR
jgi:predicted enzyme related to lactoylglutathione lyase